MAYGLKYFAEFKNTRSQYYRIRVYQRGYSGASKAMGDLCACVLEVQGNMQSAIAPIVKTQLRFSLVDTYDTPDTSQTKHGNWQEFFTPDSTLYKVVLAQGTNDTSYSDVWSGYITPDSWQESLDYGGSITITARDNIGHLNDFDFDMQGDSLGMVTVRELIQAAVGKIELAMTLQTPWNNVITAEDAGGDEITVYDACVNVKPFEGMNWYDALEQTLESLGLVLRFMGNNYIFILALRDLAIVTSNTQELEFYGGTLEFDPAVREIDEEQDYGAEGGMDIPILGDIVYGSVNQYRCKTDGNTMPGGGTFSVPEHDAPYNTISDPGKTRWSRIGTLLDISQYQPYSILKRDEGDSWNKYAFLPANKVTDGTAPAAINIFTRTLGLKIVFDFAEHAVSIEDHGTETGRMRDFHYSLSQVKYSIYYLDGQLNQRFYDGRTWGSTYRQLTADFDAQNSYSTRLEISVNDDPDFVGGNLFIFIENIIYKMWSSGGQGCYARLAGVRAELMGSAMLAKNTVKTINSTEYNVRLTRKPLFGAFSKDVGYLAPENYNKGLFYKLEGSDMPLPFPYMVNWYTDREPGDVPFPVAVHQQILCFYFGAARVLTGSCAPENDALFLFNRTATYKGHNYLFQGGTLDLFSGIIGNACFREFIEFTDLWTDAPTYGEETKYIN